MSKAEARDCCLMGEITGDNKYTFHSDCMEVLDINGGRRKEIEKKSIHSYFIVQNSTSGLQSHLVPVGGQDISHVEEYMEAVRYPTEMPKLYMTPLT